MKKVEIKILDKIIIAGILLLSILPAGILVLTKADTQNRNIVVRVDNKLEKSIPLDNQIESKIYKFMFSKGIGYVEVKNGKVRMLEMYEKICPNGICSDTGWIDKAYQSIVCLPNNIIVTIEGAEYDGVDAQAS
jgi:hypothetical protein